MRIRWERILGIVLIGVGLYLFHRLRPLMENLVETANTDRDYDNPIKALMLGVMCVTLLGGIRLLVARSRESDHE